MTQKIQFVSDDGVALAGVLQIPPGVKHPPLIVMSQGLGGHKEWALPRIAKIFSDAGLASISYDHRNFGESGGTPRYEVDPQWQIRDCRAAISYARTIDEIDVSRIGLFGTSLSGGHAIVVGALDRRVACVVAQVPTVSGWGQAVRRFGYESLAEMRSLWDNDRAARFAGEEPETFAHASSDREDRLSGRSANRVAFFEGLDENERRFWHNKLTLRSSELCLEYEPAAYIDRVSPTPLLMIIAEDDRQIGTDLQLEAFARAHQPKRLVFTKGGHYDVYRSELDVSAFAARDWFVTWLLSAPASGNVLP